MFVSMSLVAQRGHGYTRPVGARVGVSRAGVGAMVAENNYARVSAEVTNGDQYRDATYEDEGATAAKAAQCQVCI